MTDDIKKLMPELSIIRELLTEQSIINYRATIIEECAKVAEEHFEMEYERGYGEMIADAIRALKDKP